MRIYIQENNTLLKFNLPSKVDGSLLFSFKSSINGIENSINIDSLDGKWVLKSNGNINIIGSNNNVISEVVLENYMCIPVSITGISNFVCIFCLPSIEEHQFNFGLNGVVTADYW